MQTDGSLRPLGYQLLLAQDYRNEILGFGPSLPMRGVTWKSDRQISRSIASETEVPVVWNLQYVW